MSKEKYPSGYIGKMKSGGQAYLYDKGWFRGQEKNYVVSSLPFKKPRKNFIFSTKKQALLKYRELKKS